MAVVLVVQNWHHYLLGHKFTVTSDQKALKFFIEQQGVQPQFQRWLIKLLGYDFEILYQPDLQNKVANGLFRVPSAIELYTLLTLGLLDIDLVLKKVENDEELQKIIAILKDDLEEKPKYQWLLGSFLYEGRLVLSQSSSLIPTLLYTFHDSSLGGHSGFLRTYK